MRTLALTIALATTLGACATKPRPVEIAAASVAVEPPTPATLEWQRAIVQADLRAINMLPVTWTKAQAAIGPRGRSAARTEGALLDPAGALDQPGLPPGSYNCRVVRLGAAAGRGGLRAFPSQFCFVTSGEDGKLTFDKQTGTDLPTGWLYPDGDKRYVFLGAQQSKPGENSVRYGADRARDMAGVAERVGPFRWRLVVPRHDPDGLWVYELTPVPAEQQPGADPATKVGSAAIQGAAGRRG